MSEQNESTAGDTGNTEAAALAAAIAVLGPEPTPAAPAPPAPPAPVQAPAAVEAAPPLEAPGPAGESLAEVIRQQRMDRSARVAKEREAAGYKEQLEEAHAKLSRISKADMVADPIGYAQAAGLTPQEMALVGQTYLYHLVPDRAPPDLRFKLLEAKTAREQRARELERESSAQQEMAREQQSSVRQYTAVIGVAAQTWDSGAAHPFPESKAWFGGNHEEYTESMVATARNIAEAAEARGEAADLTPKAVAAVLEQDIASRAARFRTPPAAAPAKQQEPPAPSGKQPAVLSTRGQGGGPVPPAETDEERVKRAIAAAFGND